MKVLTKYLLSVLILILLCNCELEDNRPAKDKSEW